MGHAFAVVQDRRLSRDFSMNRVALKKFVDGVWTREIVPEIIEYIRIPAKSPDFDPNWQANGHIDRAVEHMMRWASEKVRDLPGARIEVVRLKGRTPVIFIEAPGTIDDTVLLYGHLDKQPEMTGWSEGFGPWDPVMCEDKLYGRGGADDGYAIYASVTALLALQKQNVPRARCVVLIEACEESGSYDLPFYVEHLADRIGSPSLVICLDSGCGNYDQMWLTTSLRGLVGGLLTVTVLDEGVHSGDASGIVPDSFRIARALLSRIESAETGEVILRRRSGRDSEGPCCAGQSRRRVAWRAGLAQVSLRRKDASAGGRGRRTGAQPHLAASTHGRRRGGSARIGQRRQCAAPEDIAEAEPAPAADGRCRGGNQGGEEGADCKAYPGREGEVRGRAGRRRLECAAARPLAGEVDPGGIEGDVRQAGRADGRRGLDPVHRHARQAFPQGAVPNHGGAWAAFERPRPERVSAHTDRLQCHRMCRHDSR